MDRMRSGYPSFRRRDSHHHGAPTDGEHQGTAPSVVLSAPRVLPMSEDPGCFCHTGQWPRALATGCDLIEHIFWEGEKAR